MRWSIFIEMHAIRVNVTSVCVLYAKQLRSFMSVGGLMPPCLLHRSYTHKHTFLRWLCRSLVISFATSGIINCFSKVATTTHDCLAIILIRLAWRRELILWGFAFSCSADSQPFKNVCQMQNQGLIKLFWCDLFTVEVI